MMLEDWLIVIVLVLSVLGGVSQGFFRSVFSLGGLVIGLAVAAWNYGRIAALLTPFIKVEAIADAVGFIVIALVVMAIAGLAGTVLHKTFHKIGLGCLDRLAGAGFGLLQGALLVTLCILVAVAFFPQAHWLVEARLPRLFFGACHLSTNWTPAELTDRIRRGLTLLEQDSPWWLHPGQGKP
jgi:membrane protein required for colicin V production